MKRLFTVLCALAVCFLGAPAFAANLELAFTGDNEIVAWGLYEPSIVELPLGPNAANWRIADTYSYMDVPVGSYTLAFLIRNDMPGGGGNPGGFLADLEVGGVDYSTSAAWMVSLDGNTWDSATTYGNNGGSNIWTSVNGGPVADIRSSAEWIWSDVNFSCGTAEYALFKTSFDVSGAVPQPAPTPEPATMILLSSGLAGLAGVRKKFKK